MSIHTVIGVAGRRVVVQPSKLEAGMVTLTIFGADRQHLCSVSLVMSAADVLGSALQIEAAAVEAEIEKNHVITVPVREPANWFDVNQAARGAA